MNSVTIKAYAKVNLALEVLGKRKDGYHNVVTILQTIDLADQLSIQNCDHIVLKTSPNEFTQPTDNLAFQAAMLLQAQSGSKRGASIKLEKAIPVSAGLAGGSSDAAAVLYGLNQLWELGLSNTTLRILGAKLGSDVPFFIDGGTALGEGRGETLEALPPLKDHWVVILNPPFQESEKTKRLYGLLSSSHYSHGQVSRKLAQHLRLAQVPNHLFRNTFEEIAEVAFPGIHRYQSQFLALGAPWVLLSGSGPALFTLLSDPVHAKRLYHNLKNNGFDSYLCPTVASRCHELSSDLGLQGQQRKNKTPNEP